MHAKYQRRYHHADTAVRQVLRNRQTTSSSIDDNDFESELTGPITITVVRTISVATSAEASTTSLAQTTASATSIGTLLGVPTQATGSTTSSVEQTSSTSASSTAASSTPTSSTFSTTSSVISTIPATATPTNSEALNAESPTSLAPGGVAGLILGGLILAFIALFLLMRTLSQRKRKQRRRRSKWVQSKLIDPPTTIRTRPNVPPPPPPPQPFVESISPTRTEALQTVSTEMTETRDRPRLLTVRNATPSIISTITYPNVSYNNVDPSLVSGTTSGAVEQFSGNGIAGFTPYSSPNTALVVCTFICTLPDELAINVGERMRVLAEYDDGWALCMNTSGEQGMVPLECLKMSASEGSISMGYSLSELDMRRSRRASSLNPMQQASKF